MAASKPANSGPYDVVFNEEEKSGPFGQRLLKAVESFKLILKREPTEQEVARIGKFIQAPNSSVIALFDGPNPISQDEVKKASSAGYSLYFPDGDAKNGNLTKALGWFKKFNGKDASPQEKSDIIQFLGGAEEQPRKAPESGNSGAYDVVFNEEDKSGPFGVRLLKAVESAKLMLKRDPTEQEVARIGKFIQAPNSSVIALFDGPNPISQDEIKKSSSAGYSLYFSKGNAQNGNLKKALSWYKKFNGKEPSEEEKAKIQEFLGVQ